MIQALPKPNEEDLAALEQAALESAATAEEVRDHLEQTERGGVRQSLGNCVTALLYDPVYRGRFRRNLMNTQIDLLGETDWYRFDTAITDDDIKQIRLYLEKHYDLRVEKDIKDAVFMVADTNVFHPIREILEGLQWDGVPRIDTALHRFLGAEQNPYTAEVLRLHMVAAVTRIFQPGTKYDLTVCLAGPQGIGKSTFIRMLAMRDEWFTDDLHNLADPKVHERLNGFWHVELAEMSALVRSKHNEEVKSFLTRLFDVYRTLYETFSKRHPRQCVFWGTTNDMQFLPFDRSGNRRFAPVACGVEAAEVHPLEDENAARAYMQQMWAEAMVLYRAGNFRLTLSREAEDYARTLQQQFMPEDIDFGRVKEYIESNHLTQVCVKEIAVKVFGYFATDEVKITLSKKITEILRKMGWTNVGPRKFGSYGGQQAWAPAATPIRPYHKAEEVKQPEPVQLTLQPGEYTPLPDSTPVPFDNTLQEDDDAKLPF